MIPTYLQKAKRGLGFLTEQRQMLIWGTIQVVRRDFAKSSLAKGMKLLGVHDSTAKSLTDPGGIHGPIPMNTRLHTKRFLGASGTPPNRHCKWSRMLSLGPAPGSVPDVVRKESLNLANTRSWGPRKKEHIRVTCSSCTGRLNIYCPALLE